MQTYTTNPYDQRVKELRSQVGDNPTAIKQAFAQQATETSQPLQESIQGQSDAITQLAELDKQLASQYQNISSAAQKQTQNTGAMYRAAGNMAAYDPSNPQAFIDRGPAQVDLNAFVNTYAPDTGLISPFAASQSADVQSGGQRQIFDLASQRRGSIERAIGTEAQAMADMASWQMEQERLQAEKEETEKERELDFIKLFGGDYNINGKTYHFDTPEEKAEKQRRSEREVLYRKGKSGRTLLEDVASGTRPFIDIVRENPELSEDEIVALGRANVSKFGAFRESNQELRQLGLGSLIDAGLTREGKSGGLSQDQLANANTLRDEYIKQSGDFDKISSSYSKIVKADPTPAGDMGLIFGYMKLLDPGSTVREGEYATAENSAGVPDRVRQAYNKAMSGEKLADSQRQDFKKQAQNVYKSASDRHEQTKKEYTRLSLQSGVDPTLVVVDYGTVQDNSGNMIRVMRKKDKVTGTIPESEFSSEIYERI